MTEKKKCMRIYRGNVLPSTLNSLKFLSYWGSSTDSFSHWIASSSVQLCTESKESGEKKNAYFKNRLVILWHVLNTKLQQMGIQQRVQMSETTTSIKIQSNFKKSRKKYFRFGTISRSLIIVLFVQMVFYWSSRCSVDHLKPCWRTAAWTTVLSQSCVS